MPKPQPNRAARRSKQRQPSQPPAGRARVKKTEKPKGDVLVGYLAGNEVSINFHRSLERLKLWDAAHDGRVRVTTDGRTGPLNIPGMRNLLCELLLDSTDEWLFMVDSDMGFEPNTLDRMLGVADPEERPIIGALCFGMREGGEDGFSGYHTYPQPTIFSWTEREDSPGHWWFQGRHHYPTNTVVQVGATGGAGLLIHRSALEKIREKYGAEWFTLKPLSDGAMQGEDISFFDRCRELTIPAHVHTGVRMTHQKTVWLSESDFWQSRVAPPAMQRCDVIVPTIGKRPENIPRLLNSLRATTGLATAWYVCDPGDNETIDLALEHGGLVLIEPGSFAHKVNFAYLEIDRVTEGNPAPWFLLVGDDVSFHPAWLDQALDVANRYKAAVVGTNDLANPRVMRGEHATHPMIRRAYVDDVGASWDGPGVVCHEGYGHCFVDDEITLVAMERGVFQAALGSFVPHHHPFFGAAAKNDAVYRQGQKSLKADQRLFMTRVTEQVALATARKQATAGATIAT